MSLYILCRIHCPSLESESLNKALVDAIAGLGVCVNFGGFEDEEKSMLIDAGYPWPSGIEFQLSDSMNQIDATGIWNEAMGECRRILMSIEHRDVSSITYTTAASIPLPEEYFVSAEQTRLGRTISVIVNQLGVMGGLIAFVEGGIEQIKFCSPRQCIEDALRFLLIPWDCLPNTAYVWSACEEPKDCHVVSGTGT